MKGSFGSKVRSRFFRGVLQTYTPSSQLTFMDPSFGRIVTADATIYITQGGGLWYRWVKYDHAIQVSLDSL